MIDWNPSRQMDVCKDAEHCIKADVPTLSLLRSTYGENAPVVWLVAELADLSMYCGVKDKMTDRQMEQCAMMIAENYHWLKVSELMLFFYRFKLWKYGSFYGAVDPSRIMEALMVFVRERNDIISRMEKESKRVQMEEHQRSAITYEQYKMMKGDAV